MKPEIQRTVIKGLNLVLWGLAFQVIDLTAGGFSFRDLSFQMDLLHDAIGAAILAYAFALLSRAEVGSRYEDVMTLLKYTSIAMCVQFTIESIDIRSYEGVERGTATGNLLEVLVIVFFSLAMSWLCRENDFSKAYRSWRASFILFGVTVLIVVALEPVAVLLQQAFGTPEGKIDAASVGGTAFFILMGIFGVAVALLLVISFIIAVVRTKSAVREFGREPTPEKTQDATAEVEIDDERRHEASQDRSDSPEPTVDHEPPQSPGSEVPGSEVLPTS